MFFFPSMSCPLKLETLFCYKKMFYSLSCFLVQLGDDVAGFVCDRYNGHVCSPSASCFGNKQKQTHQHTHTHRQPDSSQCARVAATRVFPLKTTTKTTVKVCKEDCNLMKKKKYLIKCFEKLFF